MRRVPPCLRDDADQPSRANPGYPFWTLFFNRFLRLQGLPHVSFCIVKPAPPALPEPDKDYAKAFDVSVDEVIEMFENACSPSNTHFNMCIDAYERWMNNIVRRRPKSYESYCTLCLGFMVEDHRRKCPCLFLAKKDGKVLGKHKCIDTICSVCFLKQAHMMLTRKEGV